MDNKLTIYSRKFNFLLFGRNEMLCSYVAKRSRGGSFKFRMAEGIIDAALFAFDRQWHHCRRCQIWEIMQFSKKN